MNKKSKIALNFIFMLGILLLVFGLSESVYAGKSNVDYNALARKAENLNYKQKYQQALDLLTPYSQDKNNKNSHFFNELGTAYYLKQDLINAKKYYEIAHQLDRENAQVIYNLASCMTLLNDYEEALKLFNLAESKGYRKSLIDEWRVWIKEKQ